MRNTARQAVAPGRRDLQADPPLCVWIACTEAGLRGTLPPMRTPMLSALSSLVLCLAIGALATGCDDGASDPPAADAAVDASGAGGAGGGIDPDMGPTARPEITARPVALSLVAPVGETATADITIGNDGEGVLVIDQAVLMPADPLFSITAPDPSVAPGESTTITVAFTPQEEREIRTELIINSNDREQGTLTIPVTGRAQRNCYRVMPRMVEMGTVPLGMQSGRFGVSLSNCGDVPIDVTDVYVAGTDGFMAEGRMGGELTGLLEAGAVRDVSLWFVNEVLGPDERGQAQLVILSDQVDEPEVRVDLSVRGSGARGCRPVYAADQLDFGQVRIGTEATLDVDITNQGIDPCTVRDLGITKMTGPEQNTFRLVQGLEGEVLGAGESVTLTIGYRPMVPDPVGDRGEVNFDYRDEERMENRRASLLLVGVGSEAAIGALPARVDLGLVTVPGCASWERGTEATNVGFVPICFTGYRLEGEDCASFVLLEEPVIPEDGCVPLARQESVPFDFVFQPDRVGEHLCRLVLTSDAMNTGALPVDIVGEGTDSAETTDDFTVGRLNPNEPAAFRLSRPVDAESVVVRQDGVVRENYDVIEAANSVIFPEGEHPPRDAELAITYQARCLERR